MANVENMTFKDYLEAVMSEIRDHQHHQAKSAGERDIEGYLMAPFIYLFQSVLQDHMTLRLPKRAPLHGSVPFCHQNCHHGFVDCAEGSSSGGRPQHRARSSIVVIGGINEVVNRRGVAGDLWLFFVGEHADLAQCSG
jgi:hypothetical protein